jgi:hypothetical protein
MCSEMAVDDSPVVRIAHVGGVQMLWWEQQQPGDRERQQAARDRSASPR